MPWYYFARKGESLQIPSRKRFTFRPPDALPDGGDPFTPWYQEKDHFDNNHVHVQGDSLEEALDKARSMISGKTA
jgi:hypothetical protein